jgi:hypothetical protein
VDTPKTYYFKLLAMEKGIKLKVRKDLDGKQQSNIIKLKGSLIAKGYTEIIHILDQDAEFHINFLTLRMERALKCVNLLQHLLPGSSSRTVYLFLVDCCLL